MSVFRRPAVEQTQPPSIEQPWALISPPPFPAIAMKVLEVLGNEDVDVRQVVRWIQSDPAFSGEILRAANSALFGLSSQIRSVHHATLTLGFDFVKALALTVGLRAYVNSAMKLPVLKRCWTHSLACGVISQEVAAACFLKGDEAYTAGLLHDIGRLGLLAAHPAEYGNLLNAAVENSFDLLGRERDLFDIDHCQAGAWLAEQWKLPPEMGAIVSRHHDIPAPIGEQLKPDMATVVQLGCRLADALDFGVVEARKGWSAQQVLDLLPTSAKNRFPSDIPALKARIGERVQAMA